MPHPFIKTCRRAVRLLRAGTTNHDRFALLKLLRRRVRGQSITAAVARHARPVAITLRGEDRPIQLRPGTSDLDTLEDVLLGDEYSPALPHIAGARLIVDLGCNIGLGVRLWRRHAPAARVIAVEPDEGNLSLARRNVGEDERVALIAAAIAAESGFGRVLDDREAWSVRTEPHAAGPLRLLSVPELLDSAGVSGDERIDLLKCDIEGGEAELFGHASSRQWLGRVRLLACETHTPYRVEDLERDLAAAGAKIDPLFRRQGRRNGMLIAHLRPTAAD